MLGWLFKSTINKEIDKKLIALNEVLSQSFSNIKIDIENLRKTVSQKEMSLQNFEKFEQKLIDLNDKINSFETSMSSIEPIKREEELTFTQQKILFTLFQLKKRIDQAISTKSLAKFIYAGRKYNSIRSTLSSYLDTLESNGLIIKRKLGKESYSEITDKGKEYIKSLLKKDDIKKKLVKIND